MFDCLEKRSDNDKKKSMPSAPIANATDVRIEYSA
jgi:hypothetical protein